MGEITVPAEVVGRRYLCDECGEEMHRYGDSVLMSNPPKYPHTCRHSHVAHLSRSYPGWDMLIHPAEQPEATR